LGAKNQNTVAKSGDFLEKEEPPGLPSQKPHTPEEGNRDKKDSGKKGTCREGIRTRDVKEMRFPNSANTRLMKEVWKDKVKYKRNRRNVITKEQDQRSRNSHWVLKGKACMSSGGARRNKTYCNNLGRRTEYPKEPHEGKVFSDRK